MTTREGGAVLRVRGCGRRLTHACAIVLAILLSSLSFLVGAPPIANAATGTTVVDPLTGSQAVVQTGVGSSGSLLSPATTVLGGARRLTAEVTSAPSGGGLSVQIAPATGTGAGQSLLVATPGSDVAGRTTVVWDAGGGGTPDPGTAGSVNPGGLGGVDLTDGGTHDVLAAAATASLPNVVAVWTLWTDPTHCSTTSEPVPVGTPATGPSAIAARFVDFSTAQGCAAPADPTQAGALALVLDASGAPGATVSLGRVRSATVDHGDLPPSYGLTTIAQNGAAAVVDPTLGLGSSVTGEPDGVPSDTATSDASDDGVALTPGRTWTPGAVPNGAGGGLDVTVVGTGCLDLWGDLATDATFTDAGDHLVTSLPVTDGVTHTRFPLPGSFRSPTDVTVRTRLSPRDADGSCTTPELTTGLVNGGEVEDTIFTITPPPGSPTFVGPLTPGNGTMPRWAFTADTGDTTTCQLQGPAGAGAATACTSPYDATLSDGDGSYALTVAATDALGRTTSATSSSYQLDTAPPNAPVIMVRPPNPTNKVFARWTFGVEQGATAQCRLLRGTTVIEKSAACLGGDVTYDLTGQPDGDYTFEVVAIDAAGNTGAPATSALRLDTAPPSAPTLTVTPATPTSSRTLSWTFATQSDATARCAIVGPGGIIVRARSACASPVTADLTGLPDGAYTLVLVAVDAAGNVSPRTPSTVTLDTTAPVVTVTGGPRNPGNDPTLTWQLAVDDVTVTPQCRLDLTPAKGQPTQVADWAACSPATTARAFTASYPVTADGTYTLSVRGTDAAGNVSAVQTAAATLVTATPAAPSIGITPTTANAPTADSTLSWTFSSDPKLVAVCSLGGPAGTGLVAAAAPCAGRASYDVSGDPDGTYVFTVYTTDQADNLSQPVTSLVTLDRSIPGLAITSSPTSPGNSRQPTWTFKADPGSSTECSLRVTGQAPSYGPCLSNYPGNLTGVPDGSTTFSVRARNAAGTVSAPVTSTYQLLTVPPAAPTIVARPAARANSTSPLWTFSNPAGTTAQCRLGTDLWQPCAGSWTASLLGRADGDVTFGVRSVDAAGNASAPATSLYTLDTTTNAPSVAPLASNPTNQSTVTWSFRVDGDAQTSCRLLQPGTVDDGTTTGLPAYAPCPSPHTVTLGAAQGEWVLELKALDSSGNTSPVTRTAVTLDTVPPLPPVIVAAPASPSADRTPQWTVAGPTDALTSCQLVGPGGTVLAAWSLCSGVVVADLTSLPDGTYVEQFRAQDQAGNLSPVASSQPYVLLRNAPPLPVIATAPGAGGPATALSWTFTTAPGTSTTCQLSEGDTVLVPWAACVDTVSYDAAPYDDGPLLFSVRATNATTGVTGGAAAWPYQLDRVPPLQPSIYSAVPGTTGTSPNPVWSFTNARPADVAATTCQLAPGSAPTGTWMPCTSRFAGNLGGQPQGDYTFFVRAADLWGNESPLSPAGYHYGPAVPIETPPSVAPPTEAPAPTPTRATERPTPEPSEASPTPSASASAPSPQRIVVIDTPQVTVPARVSATPAPSFSATPRPAPVRPSARVTPTAARTSPHEAVADPSPDKPPPPHTAPVRPDESIPGQIGRAVDVALQAGRDHVALPLGLLALVVGFLAVQDRLDRGDPKLAQAPLAGISDWAEFA